MAWTTPFLSVARISSVSVRSTKRVQMLLAAEYSCLIEPVFGIVTLRMSSFACLISRVYKYSPSVRYSILLSAGKVAVVILKVAFTSEMLECCVEKEFCVEKYWILAALTLQMY